MSVTGLAITEKQVVEVFRERLSAFARYSCRSGGR